MIEEKSRGDPHNGALDECRNWIDLIRNMVVYPPRAVLEIWKVIETLDEIGATPEDIGSSYDELDRLLQLHT